MKRRAYEIEIGIVLFSNYGMALNDSGKMVQEFDIFTFADLCAYLYDQYLILASDEFISLKDFLKQEHRVRTIVCDFQQTDF